MNKDKKLNYLLDTVSKIIKSNSSLIIITFSKNETSSIEQTIKVIQNPKHYNQYNMTINEGDDYLGSYDYNRLKYYLSFCLEHYVYFKVEQHINTI